MTRYLQGHGTKVTPQSEPIPGTDQVQNRSGGHGWEVDDWGRLRRFLILGTEGGTYYVGQRELSKENADVVRRCLKEDGPRTVGEIRIVSREGRAPKNDPAIFALALAASEGDDITRKIALDSLPVVVRTGTHLFQFVEFIEELRGWGRGVRTAIGRWYTEQKNLGYQLVKYRQRGGWSHRDVLRLAHPKPLNTVQAQAFAFATKGTPPGPDTKLKSIEAFEAAQRSESSLETTALVHRFGNALPREAIKPEHLDAEVWAALLGEGMPMTALIRNLATMTRVGLLKPMSAASKLVVDQLSDGERLRKARVHPIQVLAALTTYQQGHGVRGRGEWTAVGEIVDALDAAFYASFGNVEPAGKRTLLALDVSGSMTMDNIANIPGLTPRVGSAAMALVTAATEQACAFIGFTNGGFQSGKSRWAGYSSGVTPLDISPRQRLDDVVRTINALDFGGTDCALPMLYAEAQGLGVDTFVIYTDNETWAGSIHPSQALKQYRAKTGIPARLVVVGMTADRFTIADPNDAGMLDVVGFDTATPNVISDFSRGAQ
jgi:60 kDa SS-A/Ro ribonucleoprotein